MGYGAFPRIVFILSFSCILHLSTLTSCALITNNQAFPLHLKVFMFCCQGENHMLGKHCINL